MDIQGPLVYLFQMNPISQAIIDFAHQLDVSGINPIRASATIRSLDILPLTSIDRIPVMFSGITIKLDRSLPDHIVLLKSGPFTYVYDTRSNELTTQVNI
jgi:hypothetical protein